MASMLYRQESEVANELKLALEEACVELGVSLSAAFTPSAWWLFDDTSQSEPSLADLAGWVSITRRRSYRPSPLNKYKKYTLEEDDEPLQEGEEGEGDESNVEVISLGDEQALGQEVITLKERLSNASELDVLADDFDWNRLVSVHRTEHAESEDDDRSDGRDSIGSIELTVNSGGVVYFAMFQSSSDGDQEEAAVFKFGSSRLATQSERLGIEIARHLGVATPQARVIHSNSQEWTHIQNAVRVIQESAEADENESGMQTSEELLEALQLSRCMLIMGFIKGKPLAESKQAFSPEKVALRTASALGRTLVLDMVLRNEDRLVCHALGWRGNAGNLLVTDVVPHGAHKLGPPAALAHDSASLRQRRTQSFAALPTTPEPGIPMHRAPSPELSTVGTATPHTLQSLLIPEESAMEQKKEEEPEATCLLVAIDSGVARRPPKMKMEHDRQVYSKTIELLLHDEETAANLLREISFGFLGPSFDTDEPSVLDHQKVTKAFQKGVGSAIKDMQVLRMFLVKLYRALDHLLRELLSYVSTQSKKQEAEKGAAQPSVEGSSESTNSESTPARVRSPSLTKLKTSPGSGKKSPGSSPRLSSPGSSPGLNSPNRISPLKENWHGLGSPGRMTIKLKDVNKTAKVDTELSKKLEWWDEKLRSESQKLCKEHLFTTGFLEGGGSHSLVDSYELKVRLEHILERMTMISNGADTEKPSCVISPFLYIGSALAARSVHTLQHLGVTHILCLCPSDLEVAHVGDFPDLFTYKTLAVGYLF